MTAIIDDIIEANAEQVAASYARSLEAVGGPILDDKAQELLVSAMKVYLMAVLAELGVGEASLQ